MAYPPLETPSCLVKNTGPGPGKTAWKRKALELVRVTLTRRSVESISVESHWPPLWMLENTNRPVRKTKQACVTVSPRFIDSHRICCAATANQTTNSAAIDRPWPGRLPRSYRSPPRTATCALRLQGRLSMSADDVSRSPCVDTPLGRPQWRAKRLSRSSAQRNSQ